VKNLKRNKMSPDEIKHFLVSYDLATDKTRVESVGTDYGAAQAAYTEAERANADDEKLDIVLLSADSLETIKQTHASYFSGGIALSGPANPAQKPSANFASSDIISG
jgi:hypothetical protein